MKYKNSHSNFFFNFPQESIKNDTPQNNLFACQKYLFRRKHFEMKSPLVIFIVFVWFLFSLLINFLISVRPNSNKNRLMTKRFNQNFQSIDVIAKKKRKVFIEEKKECIKQNQTLVMQLFYYRIITHKKK